MRKRPRSTHTRGRRYTGQTPELLIKQEKARRSNISLDELRLTFLAGSLGQGGAERQSYYILRALKEAGTQVQVLCLTRGEYWEAPIKALGVPITWVGEPESRLRRLWRIVQWVRRERPDIIQSQLYYTNLYATVAARLTGAREIGAIRSNVFSELEQGGPLLGRLSLHLPRHLAVNSRMSIRNAQTIGIAPEQLCFLANVVDADAFTPSPQAEEGPFRILMVGRLVQLKRHDRLIEALARLRKQTHREVRGIIVGGEREGENLRPALEKQAHALGISPRELEFQGEVADMKSVYQNADCFLLTSDWEGTPNVVLEAMASGLPVVATRVGGVPDLIDDGVTGFLVDPGDITALTDRLRMLAEDTALRRQLGRQARAFILANHALQKLPQFLGTLYNTVLS